METLNPIRLINLPITQSSSSSLSSSYFDNQTCTFVTHKHRQISLRVFQSPFGPRKGRKNTSNMGAVFSAQGSNQQPIEGPPPGEPSKSWINWVVGVMLSIALPFAHSKWSRLLAIKNELDMVVKTVEMVVEVAEKVAEEVSEVAHVVDANVAEGSKLKCILHVVENVAKETSKDAHIADQFIQQVEEAEKEMESVFAGQNVEKKNGKVEDEVRKEMKDMEVSQDDQLLHIKDGKPT